MGERLSKSGLVRAAQRFCLGAEEEGHKEIFGAVSCHVVNSFVERCFLEHLSDYYNLDVGFSPLNVALPSINTEIRTAPVDRPDTFCPYISSRQKIYGLGYNLLLMLYVKTDDNAAREGHFAIKSCEYVSAERTADHMTTKILHEILLGGGNQDDVFAFLSDWMQGVPIERLKELAAEIIQTPPTIGFLTISQSRQWRLQASHVIGECAGVEGLTHIV